jgi:hypothetical protein
LLLWVEDRARYYELEFRFRLAERYWRVVEADALEIELSAFCLLKIIVLIIEGGVQMTFVKHEF